MTIPSHVPWLFGATWLLAVTASAQPAELVPAPAERLALPEVIERVLRSHPEVAAAEARYQAATHRPGQADALPDPMASTGYTAAGRPWPGAGLGSDPNASLGVMVSQAIPYPGKRQLRADVLRRAGEAQRQEVNAARLALVGRVKAAYYRLAATYQLDEILGRNEELLVTLVKVSESRYAVGQAAQQDVIRAQTQISLLALQRERIARERRTREGELNVLMSRPPDARVGQPYDLLPFALSQALPQLLDLAAAQSPLLQRDVLMASSTEAAIEVARREFKPDFAVSAGYSYMGSMPDMFEARFDVVIPLQRARRRAVLAERQNELAADRHAVEAMRLSLQGRLQEAYQGAITAGQLAGLYRDAVLPQARLALESSISSYQTGGIEFLAVLANFGSVLEYEMGYVEQLADLHLAVLRLEELSAASLLP